mgnify:CR=1 FL=1
MRTSVGQKLQRPGHGYGLVKTVTGATPESVRMRRRRKSSASSARRSSDATCAENVESPASSSERENSPLPARGCRRSSASSVCGSKLGAAASARSTATSSAS